MQAGLWTGSIFVGYVVSNLVLKKMHYRIVTILLLTVGNENYFKCRIIGEILNYRSL